MGSLDRRLARLEDHKAKEGRRIVPEALRLLSDEDLDALEDALESDVAAGEGSFEDLYAAVSERSRRALDAYMEALTAVKEGRDLPSRGPPEVSTDEDEHRDGYRIWKYYKK